MVKRFDEGNVEILTTCQLTLASRA